MDTLPPLRSVLFVPGDNEHKLIKALQAPADALVVDWEDGVVANRKAVARSQTTTFLADRAATPDVVLIRLNPVHSPYFAADIASARHARADGFVLSKVASVGHIKHVQKQLEKSGKQCNVWLLPLIESAAALLSASAIANCSPCVAALAFGAEDFCADTEITRGDEEIELLYARSTLVAAGRAAKRQVIDSPCLTFGDDQAVMRAASRARNLGFTGKLAIHPRQVEILNEAFSARAEEIDKANRILEAFAMNHEGVTVIDGTMVDEAVVKHARRILQLAKRPNTK
jgi:citrate lyase beta subunit